MKPRDHIRKLESRQLQPSGKEEQFRGYGVIGLCFDSGHILALRRFPSSSIGPAYTAVWHRDPQGCWRFYANASPRMACARYFGAGIHSATETPIDLEWLKANVLRVTIAQIGLVWEMKIKSTFQTVLMNAVAAMLPKSWWSNAVFLKYVARIASFVLGIGEVALQGRVPNRQRFRVQLESVWMLAGSRAQLRTVDLGKTVPHTIQTRLGDFRILRKPVFAIGQSYFDPYDPAEHFGLSHQPYSAEFA